MSVLSPLLYSWVIWTQKELNMPMQRNRLSKIGFVSTFIKLCVRKLGIKKMEKILMLFCLILCLDPVSHVILRNWGYADEEMG